MFFFLAPEPSPKRVSTSGPTVAETALPWKRYTDGKFGLIIEKTFIYRHWFVFENLFIYRFDFGGVQVFGRFFFTLSYLVNCGMSYFLDQKLQRLGK